MTNFPCTCFAFDRTARYLRVMPTESFGSIFLDVETLSMGVASVPACDSRGLAVHKMLKADVSASHYPGSSFVWAV